MLRKLSLGILKVLHNGHLHYKLLLIRWLHLVRKAHEEEPWFLNAKVVGVSVYVCVASSKYLDNWNTISKRFFFNRVKHYFSAQIAYNAKCLIQTACNSACRPHASQF